ncbi:MAG TPA: alpha/beta hydrolase [Chloroflexota bacterium]|nr:alpha/beta hydrolase [Chloroflexota bacterium]
MSHPSAAPAPGGAPAFDPPFVLPPSVELRQGVEFARPDGHPLQCQLFIPRGEPGGARPGIVWVHGGGWRNKAMDGKVLWRQAAHLASLGYPGVNLTYRLAPAYRFPAQLEDVQAGVRWVRAHAAELGIDPQRIGAVGESAGGHLAALLATTDAPMGGISSRVQALVAIYGVFDFLSLASAGSTEARVALLGDDPRRATEGSALWELARAASPLYHVDASTPPTLLLHGTADELVPFDQSLRFQRRLTELGVRADLIPAQGGGHGHIHRPPFYALSLEQMTAFLVECLGRP